MIIWYSMTCFHIFSHVSCMFPPRLALDSTGWNPDQAFNLAEGHALSLIQVSCVFVAENRMFLYNFFTDYIRFRSFFVEGVSFLTPFLIVSRCSWSMFCLRGTTSTDHSYHMFSGEEGDRNVATAGSQSSTCSRSGWGPHNGWLWNFIEDVKWLLLSFMNSPKVAWYYQKKVIF